MDDAKKLPAKGEPMTVCDWFATNRTEAGHEVDGIIWQDGETGLWDFQNCNDLGLIDEADDDSAMTVEYSIRLPHGSVVAVVDLGEGLNSVGKTGAEFPEIYARIVEWDEVCAAAKNPHPDRNGSFHVWSDGTYSFYRDPQNGREYMGFFNYEGETQGYYCWAAVPNRLEDDAFVGHASTLAEAIALVMKRPVVKEEV
jgi:hypothetical protein